MNQKRWFILGGVMLIGIVFAIIVSIILRNNEKVPEPQVVSPSENVSEQAVTSTLKEDISVIPPETPDLTTFADDTDRDGVLDSKEIELGTSTSTFDTDGDGLSDRAEIDVWKSDPKNGDTDEDGYADGFEVLNGYNPAGPGTIREE